MNNYYVLVASTQDLAGVTMINHLVSSAEFDVNCKSGTEQLYDSDRYKNIQLCISSHSLLTLENLDNLYPHTDAFIFLSKHRSESCIPTLTCHCTGNFGTNNAYGGNPREIAISYPSLQKGYLKAITAVREKIPQYDIIIEATHHGPTSLNKPVLFVELGSSETQWADNNAASVVCETLIKILENRIEQCDKIGIALGGTHYPIKFNNLLLDSKFGLAAVASKHNLKAIDEDILNQMIEKSIERVTHIILDSKGLGSQKDRIMKLARRTNLEVYKI